MIYLAVVIQYISLTDDRRTPVEGWYRAYASIASCGKMLSQYDPHNAVFRETYNILYDNINNTVCPEKVSPLMILQQHV